MDQINRTPTGVDFYIAASCNLNCNYCTISKNKSLKEIDKIIKRALYEDEYLNTIKEIWKGNENSLHSIDLWGGEPTIGLPWFIDNMDKFFLYFRNLKTVFLSTNLVYHDALDNLQEFINKLGTYDRYISFNLQVSIDGPPEINDLGRGNNVTSQFLINFNKLFDLNIPDKIVVDIGMKPTLSSETLKLLDSKDKIIQYYKFFDKELYTPFLLSDNKKHIKFNVSIPNFAQPGKYTKSDGKIFSKFIQDSIEINKENISNGYFNGYENIVLFARRYNDCSQCDSMKGGFCGTISHRVSILPNNKVTVCHRAFTDIMDEYVEEYFNDDRMSNKPIYTNINIRDPHNIIKMDLDEYYKVKERVLYFYDNHHRQMISVMKSLIPLLLESKQIDDVYKDPVIAEKTIVFILDSCMCMYDNIVLNGSMTIPLVNNMRLFMNGAAEQIISFRKEYR